MASSSVHIDEEAGEHWGRRSVASSTPLSHPNHNYNHIYNRIYYSNSHSFAQQRTSVTLAGTAAL